MCVRPRNSNASGLPKPPLCSSLGREAPELDQPRFLVVQPQPELREPLAKLGEEPLGVVPMLEAHHSVVSEPHSDDIAARLATPPLVDPQVEDVMQVHVRKQRRDRRPLRRSLQRLRPFPILDDPRAEPFLDQAQDPLVRDPMLDELQKPGLVQAE